MIFIFSLSSGILAISLPGHVRPERIQVFFRRNTNSDSDTRTVINQVAGVSSADALKPWPGESFSTTTPNGRRLLPAAAHGKSIRCFLEQHQEDLGHKRVTLSDGEMKYNMM